MNAPSTDSILAQSRPWDGNGDLQTLMRGPGIVSMTFVGTASIGPLFVVVNWPQLAGKQTAVTGALSPRISHSK